MKGISKKLFICLMLLMASGCSTQNQYINCHYKTSTAHAVYMKQSPTGTSDYKNIKKYQGNVPATQMNAYPVKNQMFQNLDSGTSSTGPR